MRWSWGKGLGVAGWLAGGFLFAQEREADLKKGFPDVPALPEAAEIDATKTAAMAQFSSGYQARMVKPNGKGVPEDQLAAVLEGVRKAFRLDEGGRAITVDNENHTAEADLAKPAGVNSDLLPQLAALSKMYAGCNAAQAPRVEQTYREVMRLWLKHAPRAGTAVPWMGNGYGWRGRGPKFLEMAHLLTPEERDDAADSLMLISGGHDLFGKNPRSSTDLQLNYYPTMLQAVSVISEPRRKWQRLLGLRRGLDLAVAEANLVTPDGGIIHHDGHHIAYAGYSFESVINIQCAFARVGITSPASGAALGRFKKAVEAWAWTTLQGQIPPVFQLRPGPVWEADKRPGMDPGRTILFASKVAELARLSAGRPDIGAETDLARIAASKAAGDAKRLPTAWQSLATGAFFAPLTGHRPFPVMGAAIHRREDWTVVVRGANNSRRGAEVYAGPEYPGAYLDEIMTGAVFVFSGAGEGNAPNVADSGYAAEGYNPNLFPNASAVQMDNVQRAGRGNPDYMGSGATQGGGVDLDGNGMWAWNPFHCRKSAFFFDNRVTLVTRNLTMKGQAATAVVQMRHRNPDDSPLGIDGMVHDGVGEWTLPGNKAHTMIDANRTGYHLPAGNPDLKVRRGIQEWTYVLPAYLKEGVDPKTLGPLKNRADLAKALPNYRPTEGFFSTAWYDHGANPANLAFHYTLLVRTEAKALEAFAKAAADPSTAPYTLKTSDEAHEFFDKASGTHAVATFADNAAFEPAGIASVSRPSTLMWRRQAGKLEGSVGSTALKDRRPFVIMLAGRWSAAGLPDEATLTNDGTNTRLEIPYRDQTGVKFSLKSS